MIKQSQATPTIKQIAETLGLSHSTVSRALHDHPMISDDTKKRVNEEIMRAGYVPNSAARMLRQQRSRLLGLVIPDIKNTFYTSIAQLVAEFAAAHGWQLILAITDDEPERELKAVMSLSEARAEGVIISPSAKPHGNTISLLTRMNTVQLLRTVSELSKVSSVEVDDALGIQLATDHLFEKGHRRIAYIGTMTVLSTGKNRLRGYQKSLKKHGVEEEQELTILGGPRAVFGAEAFIRMMALKKPPTAVVVAGPEIAEGVLVEAARKGIAIPGNIAMVSYGEQSWHQVIPGGVTAIHLPEPEIARACFDLLASAQPGKQEKLRIKPHLVERNKTEA